MSASTKKVTRAERELRQSAFCSNFSAKLLYLFGEKGISQKMLADAIGLTDGAISNYTASKRAPGYPDFFLICDYLGVSADYFNPAVDANDWEKYTAKKAGEAKTDAELSARAEYIKRISDALQRRSTPSILKLSEFLNSL